MFLARLVVPVVLSIALYWSMRLGYADDLARRGTPRELARAMALTPGNARLYTLTDENLRAASQLNPWNSATWIGRGLECELEGHGEEAERFLLEAARVDRTFKPLWTLANFYARANLPDRVRTYARQCLKIENRDPVPIFDLCWRVSENDGLIAKVIPPVPAIQAEYLRYLIRTERTKAAAAAYAKLPRASKTSGGENAPLFLDYCDFLLAKKSPDALAPWNATAVEKLYPENGISLTDGDLNYPLTGRGFDWRLPVETGISANLFRTPSRLLFSLDGDESEDAELLWQMLPLLPGRRYRLGFRYQTSEIPSASGLHWRIGNSQTGPDLSSDDWRDEAVDFETALTSRLARLSLRYHRRAGAMRIKGSISLAHLKLSLRP